MGNSSSLRHHVETASKTGCIQLSKSNLREIPNEVLTISHLLRTVDISNNKLQTCGNSLETFKVLKILNLSSNKLKALPSNINKLAKLEQLFVSKNLLIDLPIEILSLDNLKILNLSENRFTAFPEVCGLKHLDVLDLSENSIESLPEDIGQCTASEINLNKNKLIKLNEGLAKCPNLKTLRLDDNRINIKSITRPILADSKISLLSVEGNPFGLKELQNVDGYDIYIERYTSTKKKLL